MSNTNSTPTSLWVRWIRWILSSPVTPWLLEAYDKWRLDAQKKREKHLQVKAAILSLLSTRKKSLGESEIWNYLNDQGVKCTLHDVETALKAIEKENPRFKVETSTRFWID